MKDSHSVVILLHFLTSKEEFLFGSELETDLRTKFGPSATIFSLDNYSDSITTQYAGRLLEESKNVMILCEGSEATKLGSAQLVLNKALRMKEKVSLYCIGESKPLKPFMKFLNGKEISSINELQTG